MSVQCLLIQELFIFFTEKLTFKEYTTCEYNIDKMFRELSPPFKNSLFIIVSLEANFSFCTSVQFSLVMSFITPCVC